MKFPTGLLAFFATLNLICAAEVSSTESPDDWRTNFDKGEYETQVGAAAYFSPFGAPRSRPTENYGGAFAQLGYMLNRPNHGTDWRGNFEFAGELFGAGIFEGRGNYVANTIFWMRYNLVPPHGNLVPYFQLGAGVSLTDADQASFGQVFNFNTDAAAGLRYFIKPKCSLNAEYRFQHISNAGLADHNVGINAQGAVLSVSWYF